MEPNLRWGGEGCLGCEFGSGFLNQLPVDNEKYKETVKFSDDLLDNVQENKENTLKETIASVID